MTDVEAKEGSQSRVRNRARWLGHVRACAGSGLSVAAYCRREGLQYNSFRRWRLAFRESGEDLAPEECGGAGNEAPGSGAGAIRGSGKDESPEALFAEVTVAPMMPVVEVAALEVVLAGARRIRVAPGFDVDTLRRVVTALEDPRC